MAHVETLSCGLCEKAAIPSALPWVGSADSLAETALDKASSESSRCRESEEFFSSSDLSDVEDGGRSESPEPILSAVQARINFFSTLARKRGAAFLAEQEDDLDDEEERALSDIGSLACQLACGSPRRGAAGAGRGQAAGSCHERATLSAAARAKFEFFCGLPVGSFSEEESDLDEEEESALRGIRLNARRFALGA